MLSRTLARAATFLSILAAGAAIPGFACGEKKGGLMLAITTDMRAPKDVNVVSVAIQVGPQIKYNFIGRVTPEGEVLLPATLAIVEPDDPNETIRVRVIAFKDTKPRVLRDVLTTSPRAGRLALLRMPLSFINDGSATGALPEANLPARIASKRFALSPSDLRPSADPFNPFGAEVVSGCVDPDQTTIDGACTSSRVDSNALPAYDEGLVFRDGRDACFDVRTCVNGWREAVVDLDACTTPKGGDVTNVTLVTTSTGECNDMGQCFVPVDSEEDGWHEDGETIRLPKGVCKKLREGNKLGLVGGDTCARKTAAVSVCNGPSASPAPDGGVAVSEKLTSAEMPSGLAVYDDRLYYGTPAGLFVVPNGQAAQLLTGSPARSNTGPWFVAQSAQNVVFAEGTPILTTGDIKAHILPGGNTLSPIAFFEPVGGRLRGAALTASLALYAVTGGNGDLFTSAYTGQAARGFAVAKDTSAVAVFANGKAIIGYDNGSVEGCTAQGGTVPCTGPLATDTPAAVEAIAVSDAEPNRSWVLKRDGILAVEGLQTGPANVRRVLAADLAGADDAGNYHPRAIAATAKCGLFSSSRGIEWAASDNTTGLVTNAPGPIHAVAAPVFGAERFVYFVVRAPLANGGGIYRVRVPASCL